MKRSVVKSPRKQRRGKKHLNGSLDINRNRIIKRPLSVEVYNQRGVLVGDVNHELKYHLTSSLSGTANPVCKQESPVGIRVIITGNREINNKRINMVGY